MSTFFIADLHFGHKNCLAYDNREFPTIEEHDKTLIDRWNSVVGIDDDIWILGDISWYPSMKTIAIFKQLNGVKHLCVGNHDKKLLKNKDVQSLFVEIWTIKRFSSTAVTASFFVTTRFLALITITTTGFTSMGTCTSVSSGI